MRYEVYGEVYRQLELDTLLPKARYRSSSEALFHCVMARIANPKSKQASVQLLEQDFGISLSLEKVYRMMDQLDDKTIDKLKSRTCLGTRSLSQGRRSRQPTNKILKKKMNSFPCSCVAMHTTANAHAREKIKTPNK